MRYLHEFVKSVGVVVFMMTLMLGILWVNGYDFAWDDGVMVRWNSCGDHPTNWLDMGQHPFATAQDDISDWFSL